MDQLIQLAISLIAILGLVWLVGRMKLGGDRRIGSVADARELADEAVSGFDPVDIAIDRAGYGALLRDIEGRILVLRRHGAHFAGRLVTTRASASLDRTLLTIGTDDKRFGAVTLDLGNEAQIWATSLQRLAR